MINRKKAKIKDKTKSKERKKIVLAFVLGALIFGTIGVSAASLLYSKDVTYDNSSSGLSSTNLQDALDELYEQASSCPVCDSEGNCTVTCPSGQYLILKSNTTYKCDDGTKSTDIIKDVVTSGDGLYVDTVEAGRYIYRGNDVNNYITFNDETWRIMSIEKDGTLKIIKNKLSDSTYVYDSIGNRKSSTSTYCTGASDNACSAWAATSNLIGKPSTFTQYFPKGNPKSYTETYTGTVTVDATLNTYLNNTYYDNLPSDAKEKTVKGIFNVSTPGCNYNDTETLEVDAQQEKQYQWKGYIALITVTELLRATTNSNCKSISNGFSGNCSSNNWLWSVNGEWLLSASGPAGMWYTYSGQIINNPVNYTSRTEKRFIRPVLYLNSNVILSGEGTASIPYKIKN